MIKLISFYALVLVGLSTQVSYGQLDHSTWNDLLGANVSASGKVNYQGFAANSDKLDGYLAQVASAGVSGSKKDQLASWINIYNAYTIKLVISNWPITSIKEVAGKVGSSTPWDYAFAKVGGDTYTLNQIEHEIIRKKFSEPRIHFAVNCASESCPKLSNKAFTGSNLESQLSSLAKNFINDRSKNKITSNGGSISQLFNWFKDDFTKSGSLVTFLNKYSNTQISESANFEFLEYFWGLNNK